VSPSCHATDAKGGAPGGTHVRWMSTTRTPSRAHSPHLAVLVRLGHPLNHLAQGGRGGRHPQLCCTVPICADFLAAACCACVRGCALGPGCARCQQLMGQWGMREAGVCACMHACMHACTHACVRAPMHARLIAGACMHGAKASPCAAGRVRVRCLRECCWAQGLMRRAGLGAPWALLQEHGCGTGLGCAACARPGARGRSNIR